MVVIIDGNQLACRCYFSLMASERGCLSTKDGIRTETTLSVLTSIRKLIRDYVRKGDSLLVTWDGGNDDREKIFPGYKAGRKPFESAFYEQLATIREILLMFGIPQYHRKGVEADDIIGTLTIKSRKQGKKVFIVSSDHDFEQLISKHVEVLHPLAHNLIKDVKYVLDKYCAYPNLVPDAMALTGDPTDNIPGIEGVGDKTAGKLVTANGSLENLLNNIDKLKNLNRKGEVIEASEVLKQKIKSNIENIKLAYKLAKINTKLDFEPEFEKKEINIEGIKSKFEELEFEGFLNEFDSWEELTRSW